MQPGACPTLVLIPGLAGLSILARVYTSISAPVQVGIIALSPKWLISMKGVSIHQVLRVEGLVRNGCELSGNRVERKWGSHAFG